MIFESGRSGRPYRPQFRIEESVADHRARVAREQGERDQRRLDALASQVSIVNDPSERVRVWEQLHGLSLPNDPSHNLLRVIAAATDLQLEQVQEVQRSRVSTPHNVPAPADTELPKI